MSSISDPTSSLASSFSFYISESRRHRSGTLFCFSKCFCVFLLSTEPRKHIPQEKKNSTGAKWCYKDARNSKRRPGWCRGKGGKLNIKNRNTERYRGEMVLHRRSKFQRVRGMVLGGGGQGGNNRETHDTNNHLPTPSRTSPPRALGRGLPRATRGRFVRIPSPSSTTSHTPSTGHGDPSSSSTSSL